MRKTLLFILTILLIEAVVCGALYFAKSTSSSPPLPNLSSVDELTRTDLEKQVAECQSADDWARLGMSYTALGFYPEAKQSYLRAIELDSGSADIAYDAAFCLSRMGDIERANQLFEKAIELNHPRSLQANYFIGRNYLRAENPEGAAEAFKKSAKLPIAKFELAKLQFRGQEYEKAAESLRGSLKDEPDTPQALTLMSRIHKATGNSTEAIGTSLDASSYWARIPTPFGQERKRLMDAYSEVGYGRELKVYATDVAQMRKSQARKGLRKLNEIEWNLSVQDNLIKIANQGGRPQIAEKLIVERLERFGPSSEFHSKLGEILLSLDRPEEAVATWKIGADLSTDKFGKNCNRNLARYFVEMANEPEASQAYQKAGIVEFAREGMKYGEFSNSERVAIEGVEIDPTSPEIHFVLGQARVGLAKMEDAIASFKECLKLDPTHGRARMQLEALGIDPDSLDEDQ